MGISVDQIPDPGIGWRVADELGHGGAGVAVPGRTVGQAEGSANPPLVFYHGTIVSSSLVLNRGMCPSGVEAGHFLRIFRFHVHFGRSIFQSAVCERNWRWLRCDGLAETLFLSLGTSVDHMLGSLLS